MTTLRVDTNSGYLLERLFELIYSHVHDNKGTEHGRKAEITVISRHRLDWSMSCRIDDITKQEYDAEGQLSDCAPPERFRMPDAAAQSEDY